MSIPANKFSPEPSRIGREARCNSSIRPACTYCRIVATPPPMRASLRSAVFRALQSGVDSLGHKMERRAALHLNRVSRVVRQNKDWDVIGRRIAPPSLPRFIRPWSTNRSKHISSQDPRAHVLHATSRPFVVQGLLSCASAAMCWSQKTTQTDRYLPHPEDYPCLGANLRRNHPAKWQTNLHEPSPYRSSPLVKEITYEGSRSQALHKAGGKRKFFVEMSANRVRAQLGARSEEQSCPILVRLRLTRVGLSWSWVYHLFPNPIPSLETADKITRPTHAILSRGASNNLIEFKFEKIALLRFLFTTH